MKIVNVVDLFFPDAGYENNILSKYMVSFGHEYIILTTDLSDPMGFFSNENVNARDEEFYKKTGVKIIRLNCKKIISGRAVWNYKLFKKTLEAIVPDVVFFCGNDTLIAMQYLINIKKSKYAVITDSHMLAMASKNKLAKIYRWIYRTLITPKIIKYNIQVIRVQDDPYVEEYLGIPLSQAPFISFGTDTKLFRPNKDVKEAFRRENGIADDDFVVVYTGKLDEPKGGKLLAEAFRKKFDTKKNVVLVAVGSTAGEYGNEVEKIFSKSENRVIRFPTQKYCDLPQFYQAADLSIFARQCSLSFYDAQACGLPVLSEDNNINVERCSHQNGWNFKAENAEDFHAHIAAAANMDEKEYAAVGENAYCFITEQYNYEDKAREYEKIIIDTHERFLKGGKNA